ncbi:MAG: (Fe-S)-binding protein [Bacteroidetes bacterium]|nr:(Fe-S)-binding protein [Bacteroidota bacterium]
MISSGIFCILLIGASALFYINIKKVRRNILLGKDVEVKGDLKTMLRVAFGQSKMATRPIPFILHLFVYVGFVLINIEVLEMFVDGVFQTHRAFSFLGGFYNFLIGFFEVLAFLVTFGCAVFLIRRNIVHVKRLVMKELNGWAKTDANIILCSEIIMMSALFLMNAADQTLQVRGNEHYTTAGSFPVSQFIAPFLTNMNDGTLIFMERFCWWLHIVGIFGFLNYLPISKHLHILLAFPNTYYSNLKPKGEFSTLASVTDVVAPNFDPAYQPQTDPNNPQRFGVKDVQDLTWKNLLDAYSCTECGRCTSSCPQNITGKKLSPRKIIMDTRDRLEEVGKNIDKNKGVFVDDGKALLGDYVTHEEIWACNTCNACVQECPVNINPLEIILEMRRYLVMEESNSPAELNGMFSNVENNGAPWQFSPSDRANWINEQ